MDWKSVGLGWVPVGSRTGPEVDNGRARIWTAKPYTLFGHALGFLPYGIVYAS